MTLELKNFTDGQLPSTKTTLYQVPADTAISARVHLTNTASSVVKVNLYVKRTGGTSRRVMPEDMELPAQATFTSDYLELEGNDVIEGSASAAARVDYVVSGLRKR
jgi:hypothetical protein